MTTPAPPATGPAAAGKKKKQQLVIGGALVAGVAGYALYKSHSSAASTAASSGTTTAASTDGTSTPYSYQGSQWAGSADYSSQLNQISEELATITAAQNPPGAPASTGSTAGPAVTQIVTPIHTPPLPGHKLSYSGNVTQIAKRNGLSLSQLLALNPSLAPDRGTGKVVPAGTYITT